MVGGRRPVDEWKPWPLLTREQIEESPSFKRGMSFKTERKLREAACKVIGEAGKTLEQGIVGIATAQVYLMRFFACKAYQQNDNFIIAVAALFVASKTENKPRPLHQIAHACWKHWVSMWAKEQKKRHKNKPGAAWDQQAYQELMHYKDEAWFKRFAEAITTAERVLLYTTGFQFNVLTGFHTLLGCRAHLIEHSNPAVKAFFKELNLQIVWNFVIECYRSTRLCLQFDPRTIGIACYEMTCSQMNRQIPLVDGDLWWRYVAVLENWTLEVGNPRNVKAVQDELMKVFQPNQSKAKSQPEWGSQPGTPNLQNGSLTPGASPPPPLPRDPVSLDGGLESKAGEIHANGTRPLPDPSPILPAASPRSNGGNLALETPTAEAKERRGSQGIHFSPSDEFTASPRKQAADRMAPPDLLEQPDAGLPKPADGDVHDLQRARLEKAKALSLKRKAEAAPGGEPAAKSPAKSQFEHPQGSPDSTFGVEFEP